VQISIFVNYSPSKFDRRTSPPQKFGECVREMRLEMGLSQVEFDERGGFYRT